MNKTIPTLLLALLGSFLTTTSVTPKAAPPIPGPGGVAITIKAFLERQEAGEATQSLLVDSAHDLEMRFDGEQLATIKQDQAAVPAFFDVGCDGKPFAARTAKQFSSQIEGLIASNKKDARVVAHELGPIRANCQSAACSLAIVEFTRVYTVGGGKQMHVPMRATALLKYEQADGANFRIYHWHASVAK